MHGRWAGLSSGYLIFLGQLHRGLLQLPPLALSGERSGGREGRRMEAERGGQIRQACVPAHLEAGLPPLLPAPLLWGRRDVSMFQSQN